MPSPPPDAGPADSPFPAGGPLPEAGAGLRDLLPLLRPHRRPLVLAAGLSLVGAAATLAPPALVARVIELVAAGQPPLPAVGLVVAVLLAGAALGALQQYVLQRTAEGFVLTTRLALTDRLLRLTSRRRRCSRGRSGTTCC